ncbi:MAG: hypothetical protein KDK40_00040 [Chlamydiia bacterium]|nr:hypothetical protein [Chlamydiia bacterium]
MRLISGVIFGLAFFYGGWWLWENNHTAREMIDTYFLKREFLTLEARYPPEYILERHGGELFANGRQLYQDPELKFSPYLLLEVKYTASEGATREGVILWGMEDGEIVINTDTWETTHGFSDCIACQASRSDFRVIRALASGKGVLSRDELMRVLMIEPEVFDSWIDSACRKHLIVQRGNQFQLHFQNPKLQISPQTRFTQYPVTKPYHSSMRISRRFSRAQIENTAKAAFTNDFTIRNSQEVFLPVYLISILNPDGSIRTTLWNALNGQAILPRYLSNAQRS